MADIQDVNVKKYVWKNIVTRLRIPEALISDNIFQFDSKAFRKYCGDLEIKNKYLSPTYPQSNV